jgi:hypothetical protein
LEPYVPAPQGAQFTPVHPGGGLVWPWSSTAVALLQLPRPTKPALHTHADWTDCPAAAVLELPGQLTQVVTAVAPIAVE